MKKLVVVFILLTFAIGVTAASPVDSGIFSMASYFPADTAVFFAIRTDEAYIDDLDAIIENALANAPLPEATPVTTLRETLEMGLSEENLSLEEIYAWLGDSLAVGLTELETEGEEAVGYVVLQITDRAAAVDFLTGLPDFDAEVTEDAGFTSFTLEDGSRLLIGDEIALVVPETYEGTPTLTREATLGSSETYQSAVAALPAEGYNFGLYVGTNEVLDDEARGELEAVGLDPDTLGAVALGGTILDKFTLALDVAQLPGTNSQPAEVSRIDPAFQSYIPSDSSAFIHATDFTGLYTTITAFLVEAARRNDEPSPAAQLESGLQTVGIDLEEDILSWTTGDYAIFARVSALDAFQSVIAAAPQGAPLPDDLTSYFDFGMVIEAADPAKAQTFTTKITTLLTAFLSSSEEVEVVEDEIAGTQVTAINVTAPVSPSETVELQFVIGVNEEVFFIGTRSAAEVVFTGAGGFSDSESYQQASQYILPDATSIWYTNSEGLFTLSVVPILTLMGPSIGNVFDNIVDELEQPEAKAMTVQNEDDTAATLELLEYLMELLGGSSISATVTDEGVTVTRFVISFNAQ
jgi:hypothetical protein